MTAELHDLPLPAAWKALASQKLRQRDIATRLGVSEAQLLASRVDAVDDGPIVVRLDASNDAIQGLFGALGSLGPVMALTRNDACVHEKDGVYQNIDLSGHAGLVLGREIDLRLFYRRWRHVFAVDEANAHGRQRSLQFYLADGSATHKVFLRPASNVTAWRSLVAKWSAAEQSTTVVTQPLTRLDYPLAAEPDWEMFREDWLAMRDTHEFYGLLRRHGVERTRALRAAPPGHAKKVSNQSATRLLLAAAQQAVPIMVFVGNTGCIQIHSGPVSNIRPTGPWINVLDSGFNLHLRTDAIVQSWVVRKPTSDGVVSSLEVFDHAGDAIATFFGERKPGIAELPEWRVLLDGLGDQA